MNLKYHYAVFHKYSKHDPLILAHKTNLTEVISLSSENITYYKASQLMRADEQIKTVT